MSDFFHKTSEQGKQGHTVAHAVVYFNINYIKKHLNSIASLITTNVKQQKQKLVLKLHETGCKKKTFEYVYKSQDRPEVDLTLAFDHHSGSEKPVGNCITSA